jgi:hypothetical protein
MTIDKREIILNFKDEKNIFPQNLIKTLFYFLILKLFTKPSVGFVKTLVERNKLVSICQKI